MGRLRRDSRCVGGRCRQPCHHHQRTADRRSGCRRRGSLPRRRRADAAWCSVAGVCRVRPRIPARRSPRACRWRWRSGRCAGAGWAGAMANRNPASQANQRGRRGSLHTRGPEQTVTYDSPDDWDPTGAIEDVSKIVLGLVVDPEGDGARGRVRRSVRARRLDSQDTAIVGTCSRDARALTIASPAAKRAPTRALDGRT